MALVRRDLTIINRLGLHARAAAKLVGVAGRFTSSIKIVTVAKQADAKSIMSVLMLAATKGTDITISVDGEDAEEALGALVDLINDRFGEGE